MLFRKNSDINIINVARSEDENIIVCHLSVKNLNIVVGSIYGPNNFAPEFFHSLRTILNQFPNMPVILGGDWNATFSCDPLPFNNDCFNMTTVPNIRHSNFISSICQDFFLTDPFRFLHPNKLDFSYISKRFDRRTRSRIDYFLCSNSLLPSLLECSIAQVPQSLLFDHCAIFLNFGPPTVPSTRNFRIYESTLKYDCADLLIFSTVAESYLIHALPGSIPVPQQLHLLSLCGQIKVGIRNAGINPSCLYSVSPLPDDMIVRENRLNTLSEIKERIDFDYILSLELNTTQHTFMEVLLNNLRNELFSLQQFIKISQKKDLNLLYTQLSNEKSNAPLNLNRIEELESIILRFNDDLAHAELMHFKDFELINSEKLTPTFLKLFRSRNKESKLSDIQRNIDQPFLNSLDQTNFIVDYFSKIYKRNENEIPLAENCIEEFLGHDISNSQLVLDSKLSQDEIDFLSAPLDPSEFRKAVNDCSIKTAAGTDGLG